ncbi:hypothetical protein [Zhongshania sp. BJYM1]|uniref:hypothetical protein n=1 Tax=Zhongshania aquatica TaxID=2965069 RepID=UPI0022B444DA|nr:hypothetical protein [Marortus sp. BJYM1]
MVQVMELWAIEFQLVNSAPEHVFEWLKANVVEQHLIGDEKRDLLENSLLARDEKLINLGLALFGEVPSVGYKLYQSGDSILKRAALSGRSVKPIFLDDSWILNDDVLPALLDEERHRRESKGVDESGLLPELLSSKHIPSGILENVYEKSGCFSDVDTDLWLALIAMTVRNERLAVPYKSTWMDGFDEHRYNSVFVAAWRLFETLPVSKKAATVLGALSARLVPESPYDMNVSNVIERWRSGDEEEEEYYTSVRTALVKIIGNYTNQFKGLKSHQDLALRQGYYSNQRSPKPADVEDGFDNDGSNFLEAALYNDAFYASEEVRGALRKACWDAPDKHSMMDYPNLFNAQVERLVSKYPGWFRDSWSGEIPFEEIEDLEERRDKRLESLNAQVAELYRLMIGDKGEHQDANEFGDNSVLNDLRIELQEIGGHLGKLYQKSSFSWGWLAAGAAFGYILRNYQ